MSKGQPLISQYLAIKEANKDAVVFFQLGTFYQLYYYDAELAASILHTKIISRAIGGGQKIPMCGIPKTAGRKRAETFAREGYRVLLCDQTGEKTEKGITVRVIAEEIMPQSAAGSSDMPSKWDEYLKKHSFEDTVPPKNKHGSSPAEKNILNDLRYLELNDMTPMDALNLLQEWKRKYVCIDNRPCGV